MSDESQPRLATADDGLGSFAAMALLWLIPVVAFVLTLAHF
jgi:hypothetical protein